MPSLLPGILRGIHIYINAIHFVVTSIREYKGIRQRSLDGKVDEMVYENMDEAYMLEEELQWYSSGLYSGTVWSERGSA